MEFFSATEVVDRGTHHILRLLLGIVCFAAILYIVMGFLMDERIGFFPIVMFLICVLTFRKLGDRKHIENVRCNISETEHDFHLTMFDIATDKETVFSRCYRISKENFQVFIDPEKGMLDLTGDGTVKIFTQNEQTVYEEDYTEQVIELTVQEKTFGELVSLLRPYIIQG